MTSRGRRGRGGGRSVFVVVLVFALQQRFGISKSRMISSDFGGQSKRREGDKVCLSTWMEWIFVKEHAHTDARDRETRKQLWCSV